MIAELVQVCTSPSANPFAVDLDYFESLPVAEKLLATSAMLSLLKFLLHSGSRPYNKRGWQLLLFVPVTIYSFYNVVESDILRVSRCHFHALLELVETSHFIEATSLGQTKNL